MNERFDFTEPPEDSPQPERELDFDTAVTVAEEVTHDAIAGVKANLAKFEGGSLHLSEQEIDNLSPEELDAYIDRVVIEQQRHGREVETYFLGSRDVLKSIKSSFERLIEEARGHSDI